MAVQKICFCLKKYFRRTCFNLSFWGKSFSFLSNNSRIKPIYQKMSATLKEKFLQSAAHVQVITPVWRWFRPNPRFYQQRVGPMVIFSSCRSLSCIDHLNTSATTDLALLNCTPELADSLHPDSFPKLQSVLIHSNLGMTSAMGLFRQFRSRNTAFYVDVRYDLPLSDMASLTGCQGKVEYADLSFLHLLADFKLLDAKGAGPKNNV